MEVSTRELWTTALRSGLYHQGYMRLRDGDRYCVLGVLCAVCNVRWLYSANGLRASYKDMGNISDIPYTLFAELRLSTPQVHIPEVLDRGGYCVNLRDLSDSGFSFLELADLIERFL